jgi:hypothetical protein
VSKSGANGHYDQDDAEVYFAYKIQQQAYKLNFRSFECEDISFAPRTKTFATCEWKKNVDNTYVDIAHEMYSVFGPFDIYVDEANERINRSHADVIVVHDNMETKISLKNYKNGYSNIQVSSGTWVSTLLNLIFDAGTLGKHISPITGEPIAFGRNVSDRNDALKFVGLEKAIDNFTWIDEQLISVKEFVFSDEAEFFADNVKQEYEAKTRTISHAAKDKIVPVLAMLDKDILNRKMLDKTGILSPDPIIMLGKGKYVFSLTDERFSDLCDRLQDAELTFTEHKQGIMFEWEDEGGTVLNANMPLTFNKNGAWNGDTERVDHNGTLVLPQQRRAKAKEFATSTNLYLNMKKVLV